MLPQGAIWKPEPNNDLDHLLEGVGLNHDEVRAFLNGLSDMRNPLSTPFLEDLEKEFGIISNTNLTEEVRREILLTKKGSRSGTGSLSGLQKKLDDAGFNLFVYENNPEVDPSLFIVTTYQMIANTTTAVAGNDEAYAGFDDTELLVNGPQLTGDINYFAQANEPTTCAGNDLAIAGYFLSDDQDLIEYEAPSPSMGRWNLIFYVGGEIDEWNDSAVFAKGQVRAQLEDVLKTIILQHKPMHSWCALVVEYI